MKKILSFTIVILTSVFVFGQAKEKKVKDKFLVGKVFTVEMTGQASKKAAKVETDEISFKSEKLNSKLMASDYKFLPALYTVVEVDSSDGDKVISFESMGKNSDGEEILWSGEVTGEEIEGTAQISKKGKMKMEYSFTGTLKAKKK